MWNQGEGTKKISVLNNLDETITGNNMPDNIVNELLLSANELNIYGSSSLIEYTGKEARQSDEVLFNQIKTNPEKVYQQILKNKFDKLKQQKASASDFNVRPVPK